MRPVVDDGHRRVPVREPRHVLVTDHRQPGRNSDAALSQRWQRAKRRLVVGKVDRGRRRGTGQ